MRSRKIGRVQTALQLGDLTGAQTAFATLEKDMQSLPQGSPQAKLLSQNSQLTQALEALQTALQEGSAAGAQSALEAALKSGQQQGAGEAGSEDAESGAAGGTVGSALNVLA